MRKPVLCHCVRLDIFDTSPSFAFLLPLFPISTAYYLINSLFCYFVIVLYLCVFVRLPLSPPINHSECSCTTYDSYNYHDAHRHLTLYNTVNSPGITTHTLATRALDNYANIWRGGNNLRDLYTAAQGLAQRLIVSNIQ